MAEISRRRPDQFGYLMTVLKLSTVNLDNRAGILEQRLGRRFYSARLTRPRGAEEEKVSNGPSGSSQAAGIHLIDADNFPNCFLLSDGLAQIGFELQRFARRLGWVQWNICPPHFLTLSFTGAV
jgi:hypothetical protein